LRRLDVETIPSRRRAHRVQQQLVHTAAQLHAGGTCDLGEEFALGFVQHLREHAPLGGMRGCGRLRVHVVQQALAPAGNIEQLAIARSVPTPGHTAGGKRAVEGHQMPGAFGFGQSSIDIQQQGGQHGGLLSAWRKVNQSARALHHCIGRQTEVLRQMLRRQPALELGARQALGFNDAPNVRRRRRVGRRSLPNQRRQL
jgi:hypothetical protein